MNKSNLHRIVCLLLVLVMTFGLVACGGNTAPADQAVRQSGQKVHFL